MLVYVLSCLLYLAYARFFVRGVGVGRQPTFSPCCSAASSSDAFLGINSAAPLQRLGPELFSMCDEDDDQQLELASIFADDAIPSEAQLPAVDVFLCVEAMLKLAERDVSAFLGHWSHHGWKACSRCACLQQRALLREVGHSS